MQEPGNSELYPLLREYTRQRLWEIWQMGKKGEPLSEEDGRLYEVMEGHMQHARLWDRLDVATDSDTVQNGVNLELHILFHLTVENQLAADTPPAVRLVMRALLQKGLKEHDAVHAIASVLAWELFDMMQNNRVYDEERYVRELRKLPQKAGQQPAKKKKGRG
jgi:hypothetical protein